MKITPKITHINVGSRKVIFSELSEEQLKYWVNRHPDHFIIEEDGKDKPKRKRAKNVPDSQGSNEGA